MDDDIIICDETEKVLHTTRSESSGSEDSSDDETLDVQERLKALAAEEGGKREKGKWLTEQYEKEKRKNPEKEAADPTEEEIALQEKLPIIDAKKLILVTRQHSSLRNHQMKRSSINTLKVTNYKKMFLNYKRNKFQANKEVIPMRLRQW